MSTTHSLVAVVLFAVLASVTPRALAQVPIALDLDYALPVDAGPTGDGFGGALRFGPQLDLAILKLTSEISAGIHDFSGPAGPTMFRGVIGARLGLGVLVRPSIYGHVGVGHANFDATPDLTQLTLDLGAALDFSVVPGFELGAHAAYDFLFGDGTTSSFGFLALGGHLTFILGPKPRE